MRTCLSVLWYRGLKILILDGPSFLWSICSQAGSWIWQREKKSRNCIGYCARKVYLKILHCWLWKISTNALTHVVRIEGPQHYWAWPALESCGSPSQKKVTAALDESNCTGGAGIDWCFPQLQRVSLLQRLVLPQVNRWSFANLLFFFFIFESHRA